MTITQGILNSWTTPNLEEAFKTICEKIDGYNRESMNTDSLIEIRTLYLNELLARTKFKI
tara:strand:+ start:1756 stop:1935 length:180 start_codon:yes stop_codon:yes gene_type:complete